MADRPLEYVCAMCAKRINVIERAGKMIVYDHSCARRPDIYSRLITKQEEEIRDLRNIVGNPNKENVKDYLKNLGNTHLDVLYVLYKMGATCEEKALPKTYLLKIIEGNPHYKDVQTSYGGLGGRLTECRAKGMVVLIRRLVVFQQVGGDGDEEEWGFRYEPDGSKPLKHKKKPCWYITPEGINLLRRDRPCVMEMEQ